jgi:NitT/TauT family transport system permease protein
MTQSSLAPDHEPEIIPEPSYRYLQPSTLWNIRQGLNPELSLSIVVGSLAFPLIVWAIASYAGWVPSLFLPTPGAVWQAGMKMLTEGELLSDTLISCARVMAGFFVAAAIGVPMGIAMGTFESMNSLFAPIVGTVRYMPVTGFVPLIIIWVGLGEDAKVLIIVLGVVLYNAIMVADAVKFIPTEMINVAYTLGASRWDVLLKVIIPATFPSVLDTLRVNISGAWNYLVIAELLAAQNGLGFRIIQSQRFLQTDKVIFCILLIGVIGLVIDYGLKWMSLWLTPWADQTRH